MPLARASPSHSLSPPHPLPLPHLDDPVEGGTLIPVALFASRQGHKVGCRFRHVVAVDAEHHPSDRLPAHSEVKEHLGGDLGLGSQGPEVRAGNGLLGVEERRRGEV